MPSISECRVPYLLSNLDLVTESLTLIAGKTAHRRGELVQPQHAGGGLLGDALDGFGDLGPLGLVGLEAVADQRQEHLVLVGVVVLAGRNDAGLLELRAAQHQHGGVAAVVEDHVGRLARPGEHLLGGPPVLLEASRPSTRRPGRPWAPRRCRAGRRRRRGGVVLGGEDVARRPAHLGAEGDQRLDQHRGLDGHVQRARDPRALERQHVGVFAAQVIRPGISCSASRISLRPNRPAKVGHLVIDAVADIDLQTVM